MIVHQLPSQHTRDSIHAFIARQMADVLLENRADLGDIDACRRQLVWANFGHPEIDKLLTRARELAKLHGI